jgi:hypothetical protein
MNGDGPASSMRGRFRLEVVEGQRTTNERASRGVRPWRLGLVLCLLIASLGGCGGKSGSTDVQAGKPNRRAGSVELGSTIGETIARVGEPVSRSREAGNEELNYGFWQLAFKNGRLVRKTRVRVPGGPGISPTPHGAFAGMGKLAPGVKIGQVRRRYGSPEVIYEV